MADPLPVEPAVRSAVFEAASVADLGAIRSFVREASADLGVPDDAIVDLVIAVDEAAANVFRHGYGGAPGRLEIRVGVAAGRVAVDLLDEARPFDPTTHPSPDLTIPLEDRPAGGLGIHLARECVDVMSYARVGGHNQLVLAKALTDGGSQR